MCACMFAYKWEDDEELLLGSAFFVGISMSILLRHTAIFLSFNSWRSDGARATEFLSSRRV